MVYAYNVIKHVLPSGREACIYSYIAYRQLRRNYKTHHPPPDTDVSDVSDNDLDLDEAPPE